MAKSLTENRKKQLDGIVQRMINEGRSDKEIQTVVNDFKSIHSKGFVGNFVRESVALPIKSGIQNLRAIGDISRGQSFLQATEPRIDPFVGPVSPIGVQGERQIQQMKARGITPTTQQQFSAFGRDVSGAIGRGFEIGSLMPWERAVLTAGQLGTQVAKQGLKQYTTKEGLRYLGREGLSAGIESGFSSGLNTLGKGMQEQTPVGQLAKETAISTGLGAGAGLALGAGGAVVGTGLRQGFRGVRNIGTQTERLRGAIGTPSTRLEQAEINRLEKDFETLFDEKKSTIKKNDILSRFGQTPARIFAESGYMPKIEGNKIRTDDFIDTADNFIRENAQSIQKVLDSYDEVNPRGALSYSDFRNRIIKRIESNPDFAGKVTQLTNKLDEFLKDYKTAIKSDKLGFGQLNRLRVQSNINTKKFKFTDPEKALVDDLDNVIGDSVREVMTEKSISPTINQVNQEIGKLIKARNMARYINGNTVNGGALTNMLVSLGTGAVTATVTGGQSAIIRGILSLVSAFGARQVLDGIRSLKFGGIIRRRILRNIGLNRELREKLLKELPEIQRQGILREIQDALRETPQLPAPKAGSPRSRIESGRTIELPSRSQSTVDAEEMTRVQGQIKKPKLSLKDQGGFIAGSFKNEGNLTTKILKDLEGKTTVSKQYILDATNRGELKQVERDITRQVLEDMTRGSDNPLVQEAKKYKSAEEFVSKIQGSATQYGDYTPQFRHLGMEDYKNVAELGVKPDKMVTIYRGIDDITGKIPRKINDGDFVTTDFDSAMSYAGKDNVVSMKVPAKTLYTDAIDDFKADPFYTGSEYVYTTQKVEPLTKSQLTDIWNKAQSSDTINVKEFADKVKSELLPLDRGGLGYNKYENITLPGEIRGDVKNYREHIYNSPIQTSAGDVHFSGTKNNAKNYFGHTRIEDMADNKTRRVIEVQSDLYQKGNLEREMPFPYQAEAKASSPEIARQKVMGDKGSDAKNLQKRVSEVEKLQQYNDPTAHFRMIREEIRKAAEDGKTKLQFPTGDTAMKIEGLGDNTQWRRQSTYARNNYHRLTTDDLKVGANVNDGNTDWIITDVLGDGKFKAVPKRLYDDAFEAGGGGMDRMIDANRGQRLRDYQETFDISGKVDTNNPIYKFYEKDVQKYLNKFGGKRVVDDKGVSWIEIPITKEQGISPVEAFGKIKVSPLVAGAVTGTAGVVVAGAINKKKKQ